MKNSKVTLISEVLFLFLSFAMFILSILADKYLLNIKQLYEDVLAFSGNNPFEDFYLGKIRCETGYEPIFNYTYPGNEKVCFDITNKEYKKGDCISNGISKGIDILNMQQASLPLWRYSVICGKRYKNWNTIKKNKIPPYESCQPNEKKCGIFNSGGDILCLDKSLNCPINFFKILNYPIKQPNFFSEVLDEDHYLVVGIDSVLNDIIPVDFAVSNGYPCILSDRISTTSAEFPFSLNSKKYGCNNDANSDMRYIPIDTIKKGDLFLLNDLEILNGYPSSKNWINPKEEPVTLFMRPRISVRAECEREINGNKYREIINSVKFYQFLLVIIQITCIFILIIFMAFLSLMKLQNKMQNVIIGFLKIFFCCVYVGFNYYLVIYCFSNQTFIEDYFNLINSDCLDSDTLDAFNHVFKIESYIRIWRTLITIIFYLNIPLIILIVIQTIKYFHKLYVRIRTNKRNKEAKELLEGIIDYK